MGCVSWQSQHVLNLLAGFNSVWQRRRDLSYNCIPASLEGDREVSSHSSAEKSAHVRCNWTHTGDTLENMLCYFHCSRNSLVFQEQTTPDLSRLWENTEVLSVSDGFQSVSASSPPGRTSALFLAQLTASCTLAEKWVGQGWGTKALGCCTKPAFYCPQGRKFFPALGASKCSAAVATGWGATAGWKLCGSMLRGRDAVESWQGCGRHINI